MSAVRAVQRRILRPRVRRHPLQDRPLPALLLVALLLFGGFFALARLSSTGGDRSQAAVSVQVEAASVVVPAALESVPPIASEEARRVVRVSSRASGPTRTVGTVSRPPVSAPALSAATPESAPSATVAPTPAVTHAAPTVSAPSSAATAPQKPASPHSTPSNSSSSAGTPFDSSG